MKPTTKPKQREHVEHLIGIVNNLLMGHAVDGGLQRVKDGLVELLAQLRNRPPIARGRTTADSLTPAKIAAVLQLRAEQPNLSGQEIANRLNLNVGRVSEVLRGKRT